MALDTDSLADYRYQPLPNLTGVRQPGHDKVARTVSSETPHRDGISKERFRALARLAYVLVILRYLDSQDFLFGEVGHTEPESSSSSSCGDEPADLPVTLRPLRARMDTGAVHTSWTDLASDLGNCIRDPLEEQAIRDQLAISESQYPYPVVFSWGSEGNGLLEKSPSLLLSATTNDDETHKYSLDASCDGSIMSDAMLHVFLLQVDYALQEILAADTSTKKIPSHPKFNLDMNKCDSDISISESADQTPVPAIFSVYEPTTHDLSTAFTPLTWLTQRANTHPNFVAHEIHTSDSLSNPSEKPTPASTLTYAQLNGRANALAQHFLDAERLQIKKGDKVAVCSERDALFYIVQAAIWKVGAVYVSIDPTLPPERQTFIAQDSDARLVIVGAGVANIFGAKSYVLEEEFSFPKDKDCIELEDVEVAGLDDLAYLLYTSGTTGKPKGCLLAHRGVYWAVDAMCTYPRSITVLGKDKRLALASIAFDVHISEMVVCWSLGLCLVSGPRFDLLANLYDNIRNLGITHLGMVPSMIEGTFTGGANEGAEIGIKFLVSGGEKISDGLLKKWANHPTLILANFYGPTEATIGCTSRRVALTDRKENIGLPFPSCRAYVVNPNDISVVPRGAPGELIVEGPLIGYGYHNLPDVTRKVFLEWPRPGCRAYRTGDLVRMMPDNTLEIMGRIDSQIKLRGVRIESDGISSVIREAASSSIGEELDVSTIIGTHSDIGGGSEGLVSFVAPGGKQQAPLSKRKGSSRPSVLLSSGDFSPQTMKRLKDAVNKELAAYMRPSFIVPVSFLPLSLNGKTDNKVLADVYKSTPVEDLLRIQSSESAEQSSSLDGSSGERDRAPTEVEQQVIDLVTKLVRTRLLGPSSNLFEVGLDSIKFATLARDIRKLQLNAGRTRRRVGVADLMIHPTVAAIASLIEQSILESPGSNVLESKSLTASFDGKWRAHAAEIFEPNDIEAVLPPFPVQEGVLFRSIQEPGHYVQHFTYRCSPDVDLNRLKTAWGEAISKHQILRTVFITDDVLLQVVLKPGVAPIPWRSHHPYEDLPTETPFEEWFHHERASVIATEITEDVTTPLLRVNIYISDHDETFMVLSINHAIYDGISVPLLVREVVSFYDQQETIPFVDLAGILNEIPPSDDPDVKEFWLSKFSGIDTDRQRQRRPTSAKATKAYRTFEGSFSDYDARCNALRITFQALATTAFGFAGREILSHGPKDALFGVIRSGRSLPVDGAETAMCPLVCVVPTRVQFEHTSIAELLSATQKDIAETSSYEHTSLGRIQRWLSTPSLVEALFSCRIDTPHEPYSILTPLSSEAARPEFIIAVELVANPVSDSIEARVAYTEPDVTTDDVERFLEMLESNVAILASVEGDLSDLLPIDDDVSSRAATSERTKDQDDSTPAVDVQLERKLTNLVAKFLKVEITAITPRSSLVSLGLDSLRAVSLARALAVEGISATPIVIIQSDNIRDIAAGMKPSSRSTDLEDVDAWSAQIQQTLREELPVELLRLDEEDCVEIVGATALQSGMLSQTLSSRGELYVHAFTFKLLLNCNIESLREAWLRAITKLEILRTSFHFANNLGRWAQAVHSSPDFKWSYRACLDVSTLATDLISTLSFTEDRNFARSPVYFQHASCDGVDYLVVVLHHALYDGVSLPRLFAQVRDLYDRDFEENSIQFRELVPSILAQEKAGTEYWVGKLANIPLWRLPRKVNDARQSAWRSSIHVAVDLSAINRTCRRYQISSQCIGQAAWAKVLAVTSGNSDVVYGQVVSGRALSGAEDVIAPVFNTIPCRVVIEKGQTNKELLRSVQQWNIDGLPWHHASLRLIQHDLGIQNLCDTLFLYQPGGEEKREANPLWEIMGRADVEQSKTQYAVNVELHQDQNGFNIHASCASDVLDRSELDALLEQLSEAIVDIVTYPNNTILPDDFSFSSSKPVVTLQKNTHDSSIPQEAYIILQSWSSRQKALRDIIVKFSKLPETAIHPLTNLAAVGVDSISAIQIAALCKKADLRVSSADIASSSTLDDLAKILERQNISHGKLQKTPPQLALPAETIESIRDQVSELLRNSIESVLPTTAGMDWLIAGWQRSGGSRFQHAFVLKSTTFVNGPKLARAWESLAKYHSILRSTFVPGRSGDPFLVTFKSESYHAEWHERYLDGADALEALRVQARESVTSPPLTARPPTRLTLLHAKSSSYLIINLHHMQYDAWSLRLLFDDLELLYKEDQPRSSNDIRPFIGQYTTYAKNPKALDEHKAYWRDMFPPAFTPILFPILNPLPHSEALEESSPSDANLCQRVNRVFRGALNNADDLATRSKSYGLPLHTLLLACWARIQSQWSTPPDEEVGRDAVFGLWHAGRSGELELAPNVDMNMLAIPTINILPVRVTFPPTPTSGGRRESTLHGAHDLRTSLQSRTPAMEQDRLVDVHDWVGRNGKEGVLCNVFVNVLKVPRSGDGDRDGEDTDEGDHQRIFKPVRLPYASLSHVETTDANRLPRYTVTDLVQDDLLVEIFFNTSTNSAGLAIECDISVMNEDQAGQLMKDWVAMVYETLDVGL